MTLNVPLSPETAATLREHATKAGKDVEAFVREAIEEKLASGSSTSSDATVPAALAELDQLRIGNRLDGLSIRELIEEGRRL